VFAVLDTNHYVEWFEGTTLGSKIARRVIKAPTEMFTTVVTVQEIAQGWLAEINRRRSGPEQVNAYRQFQHSTVAFSKISILPFDSEAAQVFLSLQKQRLGTGTMDLKIASICLAHDATLLTRNLVDFEKIPGLRVENWLD